MLNYVKVNQLSLPVSQNGMPTSSVQLLAAKDIGAELFQLADYFEPFYWLVVLVVCHPHHKSEFIPWQRPFCCWAHLGCRHQALVVTEFELANA